MYRIKEILRLPVQFVFLTGTLPYILEEELVSRLYLKDLSIIRASCLRSNISYRTSVYSSYKEEERIEQIRDYINNFKVKEFLSSTDKVLIFCPTITSVDLLASYFTCSKYHSSLSEEEKERALNGFLNSKEEFYSILVCTTALEEGFDYSYIRLVVYKDYSHSFLGFLQGSSRGGRDNQPCTSMFFYNSKDYRLLSNSSNNLSLLEQDKSLIKSYLLEKVCRKRQIGLYLDNTLVDQCSTTSNLCDLCSNRSNIVNKQVLSILDSNKRIEEEREDIKSSLKLAFNNCVFCFLLKGKGNITLEEHSSSRCSLYSGIEKVTQEIRGLITKKRVLLKEDSCCFICLLPTVLCTHLKGSASTCVNSKFMYRVLALFYAKRNLLELQTKFSLREGIGLREFLSIFLRKEYIIEQIGRAHV